jgi:hypothetical protein
MESLNKLLKEEDITASQYALKMAFRVAAVMHRSDGEKIEELRSALWQRIEKSKQA